VPGKVQVRDSEEAAGLQITKQVSVNTEGVQNRSQITHEKDSLADKQLGRYAPWVVKQVLTHFRWAGQVEFHLRMGVD
jgi:hypothetical protein